MDLILTRNYNGKLFNDNFSHVALADPEMFSVGTELDLLFMHRNMGKVKVVAAKPFLFKYITDVLSYLDCGQPAHYLAQLVRIEAESDIHNKIKVSDMTELVHVVFQYTERNVEMHGYLLNQFYQNFKPKTE